MDTRLLAAQVEQHRLRIIKVFGGKEYLIIEWKSGDYRFGGRDTDYYVMARA